MMNAIVKTPQTTKNYIHRTITGRIASQMGVYTLFSSSYIHTTQAHANNYVHTTVESAIDPSQANLPVRTP